MTARSAIGWLAAAALVLAAAALFRVADTAMLGAEYLCGWALALAFLLLAAHGMPQVKRRWPGAALLRLHLHLGWIATLLFLAHGGGFPGGGFYRALWLVFALALASGAVGLCLERICTRRQRDWDALPYPRIAQQRAVLAAAADDAFQEIVRQGCPPVMARLYARRLLPFLRRPAHPWQHWTGYGRPLDDILEELSYAGRTLSENRDFLRIREIVVQKAHLDERWALYWLQRGWLFVHLPAAAAAAVFVLFHVVLVHSFGG